MLDSKNLRPGEEQYEIFHRKMRRQWKEYCQYDYRHTDGRLFSCVAADLETCRKRRDVWLEDN